MKTDNNINTFAKLFILFLSGVMFLAVVQYVHAQLSTGSAVESQVSYHDTTFNSSGTTVVEAKADGSKTVHNYKVNHNTGVYSYTTYDISDDSGDPVLVNAPPGCTTGPELTVSNVGFVLPGDPYSSLVDPSKLEVGVDYEIFARVTNIGCVDTDDGTVFLSEPPYGTNGGFPVILEIDFGNNGSIEYAEVEQNIGPLAANGGSTDVRFARFTAPSSGSHKATAIVDPTRADHIQSCTGSFGCINEIYDEIDLSITPTDPQSNHYTRSFNSVEPKVWMGTYLWTDPHSHPFVLYNNSFGNYEHGFFTQEMPANQESVDRDLSLDPNWGITPAGFSGSMNRIGVFWNSNGMLAGGTKYKCTGGVTNSGGTSLSGFQPEPKSAVSHPDRIPVTTVGNVVVERVDSSVPIPPVGDYHIFSLECETNGGGMITESMIVNNGASLSNVILLEPDVSTVRMKQGDTLTSVPFRVNNTGFGSVSGFSYTIDIAGNQRGNGNITANINPGAGRDVSGGLSYTATNNGVFSLTVCVQHPSMGAEQCDSASLVVEYKAPECSDGINNDPSEDFLIDIDDPNCHQGDDINQPYVHNDCCESGPLPSPSVLLQMKVDGTNAVPWQDVTAYPMQIAEIGGPDDIEFRWWSIYATSCIADVDNPPGGSAGGFNTGGSVTFFDSTIIEPDLGSYARYRITCTGITNPAAEEWIEVQVPALPPTLTITPVTIVNSGDTVDIAWDATGNDVNACRLSGPGLGSAYDPLPSETGATPPIAISGESDFVIECDPHNYSIYTNDPVNPGGRDTQRVTITTEFLET